MSEQHVSESSNPCISSAAESVEEAPPDAQLPVAWRNALERIAVLCLADFDASNPDALVERVQKFSFQLIDGFNAKDKERGALVQKLRAAVREGWDEARAIQESNKHDKSYVLGLRAGSNFVAMYVYRALHEVQHR